MTRLALTLLLVLTLVASLAGTAEARSRLTLGMGEQNSSFFDDPRVEMLGLHEARLIVAYDLADSGLYDPWLEAARSRGINVLVAFDHNSTRPKKLPSVSAYKRMVRRFLQRYPWIRTLSAWNEANHRDQPTHRRAGRAAMYYNALRKVCRGCTIVAADVLVQRGVYRWLKTFKRHVRGRPRLWGIHNYVDANRGRRSPRRSSTARIIHRLPGRVWVTETGGVVAFKRARARRFSYHYNEGRAARATTRVFRLARALRKITRVYLYHWRAPRVFATWDSGLVESDGRSRPALEVLRREVNRQRWLRFEDPVPNLPDSFPDWTERVASYPNVVPALPPTSPSPPSGGIARGGR